MVPSFLLLEITTAVKVELFLEVSIIVIIFVSIELFLLNRIEKNSCTKKINSTTKVYDIEKSILDNEKKCVRVPVNMVESNWIDAGLALQIERELDRQYPDLLGKFTGKWDTKSHANKVEEYIFFYK